MEADRADVWRHYDDESVRRLCVCVLARCLPYLRASLLGPVPHDVRFPRGVHDTSPRRRNLIDFPRNHHPFLFTCFGSDTLWIIGPNVYIYIYIWRETKDVAKHRWRSG